MTPLSIIFGDKLGMTRPRYVIILYTVFSGKRATSLRKYGAQEPETVRLDSTAHAYDHRRH